MVDVAWEALHWRDFAVLKNFDPDTVSAVRSGTLSAIQARFLYSLAWETRDKGMLLEIGDSREDPSSLPAQASKDTGVDMITLPPRDLTKPGSVIDRSPCQGSPGLILIDARNLGNEVETVAAKLKPQVAPGAVLAFIGADDAGGIDAAVDRVLAADARFTEIQGVERVRAFRMHQGRLDMILCAGLQSGGTTLISWCFLQRSDADGVLDMWGDRIELMPYMDSPIGWCKMTVASFRWQEVADFYSDLGWSVKPLLVIRNPLAAYASLRKKRWSINGLTAEDTPYRIRYRRFLADWEQFRTNGWPIIHFESFMSDPERTLRAACDELEVPWDDGMLTWPKDPSMIAGLDDANRTFRDSLKPGGLQSNLIAEKRSFKSSPDIPYGEVAWLDRTFSHFNEVNGYVSDAGHCDMSRVRDRPNFSETNCYKRRELIRQLNAYCAQLESELSEVFNSVSWRLTAPLRRVYGMFRKVKE